jgi:hypothetical protein
MLLLASACPLRAVMIAPFPGLPKLIEEADAIAIIEIKEQIPATVTVDHWALHRCLALQTLKGNFAKDQQLIIELVDIRFSFVSPFSIGSTHLAFLCTNGIGGNSKIRNLQCEGSMLRLSPFGHETEPEGATLEQKIKNQLQRSIAYWDGEQQREKELALAVIAGKNSPSRRELEKAQSIKADPLQFHDLPRYGRIPALRPEWMLRGKGAEGGPEKGSSWLVFTNSLNGDFLSISADQISDKPYPKVNRIPWSDMAGDRFPGGYPASADTQEQRFEGSWIRNEIVDLSVNVSKEKKVKMEQALEYTIIFESRTGPARMAHGYALPLGRFRLLVQHASTNVITPEFAKALASQFLYEHIQAQQDKSKN